MRGLLVVLQGRPVAEDRGAEGTRDDLAGVCRPDVTIETCATSELGVALLALELFLAVVGLEMPGQGLAVLEGGPALVAREGLGGRGVKVLVNGQVVFPGEGLEAEVAGVPEVRVGLVGSLVSLETVAPLEGLSAV